MLYIEDNEAKFIYMDDLVVRRRPYSCTVFVRNSRDPQGMPGSSYGHLVDNFNVSDYDQFYILPVGSGGYDRWRLLDKMMFVQK